MRIKKLVLKNFLCYKDTTIHFSSNMVHLIGESGSGKTTILEAILFLFFNRFPRGGSGLLKNTFVEADIQWKGKLYTLSISIKNNKKLYTIKTEDKTYTSNQVKEYKKHISNIFGEFFNYNYGDIIDLIFLSSLTVSKTFNLKLTDLLMDYKLIEKYKKIFKSEENFFYDKIRMLDGQINEINNQIAKIKNRKESQYTLEEVLEHITDINNELQKITNEKNSLLQQQISYLQDKATKEKEVNKYKTLLTKSICPVCERPFEVKDKNKYKSIKEQNEQDLTKLSAELKNLEKKISELDKQYNFLNKELLKWRTEQNLINSNKKNKEKEVQELTKRLQFLKENRRKYDIYVTEIQNLQKYFNKQILLEIRKYILGLLLNQMKKIVNQLFNEPCELSIENDTLYLIRNGLSLPYDLLSRGEKTRVYIAFLVVFYKFLHLPFGLLIDELLDSLDINNYYKVLEILKQSDIPFVIITTTKLDEFDDKLITKILVNSLR